MIPVSFRQLSDMIDGFKCLVHDVQVDALKNKLEFYIPVNESTGEAIPYSYAKLGNLRVSLNQSGKCTVRGSLHKYAHSGMNNTDFAYSDLIGGISNLSDVFQTCSKNFALQNLEYGVNLDYPPAEICDNLLLFGPNAFAPMSANLKQYLGMVSELSRYNLKIYGKTQTQLRLETHVKKMGFLSSNPLSFESLTDKNVLVYLGNKLLETWEKVVIWEEVDIQGMLPMSKDMFTRGKYPGYWTDLHKTNPENFKKKRARFLELQQEHKLTSRKENVSRLAAEKWSDLLHR